VLEGITIPEMDIHQKYMKLLDGYIDQKLAQIRFQQVVIDKQVERVREAKIEISTIEKLREKKLEEYNHIALKKAEEFIEEYVTTQTAMKAV
jgi:flagellar FliJ protein